jgi:predicted outer membrane repeat protein
MLFFAVLGCSVFLEKKSSYAFTKKDGFTSLKKILEQPGEADIVLNGDIRISGTVHVRGKKKIDGNGYRISRGTVSGKLFGGTLFSVETGEFVLRDTVVSGDTGNVANTRVYGRLVEVKKGSFVLGRKGNLINNSNITFAEEGGGAVVVRSQGKFIMNFGKISGNQTVTEGAAVFIEKGGLFRMKGGIIQKNKSRGIGAIEGFDGRGGAIYNLGTVVISDGLLKNNCAVGFKNKVSSYGGVGGMLYNRGRCVITGGTIEKNTSSYGGGAIYSDKGSALRITDCNFQSNQAQKGKTIFFCGTSCYLNVHLNKKEFYDANQTETKIETKPHKDESLKPLKPEGKKSAVHTQAKKTVKPIWKITGKKRIYYTGEYLTEKELRYGIQATADGKEITKNIYLNRISGVMGRKFDTSHVPDTTRYGTGKMYFKIKGYENEEIAVPYEIKKNNSPHIRVAPRFLFTWEVSAYSDNRWKDMVFEGIALNDREDEPKQLWKKAKIDFSGAKSGKQGSYKIKITITDQWGHRFYMKKGIKRQYGKGKNIQAAVLLTLVSESSDTESEYGVIQFLPEYGEVDSTVEEWTFFSEDMEKIRNFIRQSQDPFSEMTNNAFIELFKDKKSLLTARGG